MSEEMMLFEDIYEPIKFQMKNNKGEVFNCETQFRSIDVNLQIQKLSKDPKNQLENAIKMMVLMCGQSPEFWGQFSDEKLLEVTQKVVEAERNKYKKKMEKNQVS
jgi:hypothetical protein